MSLRPVWSIKQVSGQPRLDREILSPKTKRDRERERETERQRQRKRERQRQRQKSDAVMCVGNPSAPSIKREVEK